MEGQGAIYHPAYSGVTLGLLHGSAPDVLVLVHKAGATSLRNYPDLPLQSLPDLVAAYEAIAAPVRPARVAAVALNTSTLDEDAARAAVADAESATGLPADDVVRFGAGARARRRAGRASRPLSRLYIRADRRCRIFGHLSLVAHAHLRQH